MIQSFSPWTTERHVGYVTECFHKGCRSNDSYIPKIEVCHWISRCLLRRILRHTRKGEKQLATTTESLTHSLTQRNCINKRCTFSSEIDIHPVHKEASKPFVCPAVVHNLVFRFSFNIRAIVQQQNRVLKVAETHMT
jgi:hypothetical protein